MTGITIKEIKNSIYNYNKEYLDKPDTIQMNIKNFEILKKESNYLHLPRLDIIKGIIPYKIFGLKIEIKKNLLDTEFYIYNSRRYVL